MSSKLKKHRRLSKGLVVECVNTPGAVKVPERTGWQFDFSTSPCRSNVSQTAPERAPETPSQAIDSDDRECSLSEKDIFTTSQSPQPASKRVKLSEVSDYSSPPRIFAREDADRDSSASPVISRNATEAKCFKENVDRSPVEIRTFLDEFDCDHDGNEMLISPELPRTQVADFSLTALEDSEDDIPSLVHDDTSLVLEINSQSSESECGSPPLARSDVKLCTADQKLTATEWFKKINSSAKSDLGTQESGKISEASSPSQSNPTTFSRPNEVPNDSDWSSCKKKRRQKFGLAMKFDAILKKDASDRVLRNHISSKSVKLSAMVEASQGQKKQGLIERVEQINNSILFVECRNLKLPHRGTTSATFKVVINVKLNSIGQEFNKIIPGNEISLEGPWKQVKSEANNEDILMDIENLKIYENESPDVESNPIILLTSCCKNLNSQNLFQCESG